MIAAIAVTAGATGVILIVSLVHLYRRYDVAYRSFSQQLAEIVATNAAVMQQVTAALDQLRQAMQEEFPLLIQAVRDMINEVPAFERRLQHLEEEYSKMLAGGAGSRNVVERGTPARKAGAKKRPGGDREDED